MNRRLCLILIALAGFGGWLIGYSTRTFSQPLSADDKAVSVPSQATVDERSKQKNAAQVVEPISHEDSLILSKELVLKYWPSPLINYKLGKFQSMSFFVYGLGLDGSTALVNELNAKIDELFELEMEHSKLITDNRGNQYILIGKFEDVGNQIKESIRKIALDACKDFPDQRGELLAHSLVRNSVFNSFGQARRELAIEEVTNGNEKRYVLKIHSQASANIKEESNAEISGNYEADRFQRLVQKHIDLAGKGK